MDPVFYPTAKPKLPTGVPRLIWILIAFYGAGSLFVVKTEFFSIKAHSLISLYTLTRPMPIYYWKFIERTRKFLKNVGSIVNGTDDYKVNWEKIDSLSEA